MRAGLAVTSGLAAVEVEDVAAGVTRGLSISTLAFSSSTRCVRLRISSRLGTPIRWRALVTASSSLPLQVLHSSSVLLFAPSYCLRASSRPLVS